MTIGNAVMTAAIMRGVYVALGTGISTALLVWATTDDWKPVIIAGATSALAALGFRGGFEGVYDSNRASTGNMNEGDVAMASPKVEVVPTGSVGDITVTGSVASTSGTN
jgi:hypothetical protein